MNKSVRFMSKLISIICIIAQMFVFVKITAFSVADHAKNTDNEIANNEQSESIAEPMNNTSGIGSSNIAFSIIEPEFLQAGTTCVMFDPTDVISCSYVSEGLQVVRDNNVLTKFTITANDEFGKFSISAQKVGGITVNKTLYTYCSGDDIFVSDVSKDSAWHSAKLEDFNKELITTEEWHEQYSSYSLSFSEDNTTATVENNIDVAAYIAAGNIVVTGKMTWKPNDEDEIPLRFTKVELRKRNVFDSESIDTTFTDENGDYYFVIDPDEWDISPGILLNLFVRTYVESKTTKVVFPFWAPFNYFDSNTVLVFASDAREINISRTLVNNESNLPYQLVYIQQGMVVGERFATEMGMETDEMLYVFYVGDISAIPYEIIGMSQSDFLDFVANVNGNAFCYDTISFIGVSHYKNFMATIHEYGHFVENRIGTYGPAVKGHLLENTPESYDGTFEYFIEFIGAIWENKNDYIHNISLNHFNYISNTAPKIFQMELAWSEAWANAFAEIAFNYFKSDYPSQVYSSIADFETKKDYSYGGEAQEYAVTSFLWDLFDSSSTSETYDKVSMDEQDWWDITTESGICTIQDFSENILENYPELISGVGELMSKHNISPEIYYLAYNHATDSSPRLLWNKNGGQNYRNNIFRVAFYDNENNLLGITDEINSYTDSSPFTVPTALWNTVMAQEKVNTIIYAVVYGYRSGSSVSGPYFSARSMVYDGAAYHSSHTATYTKTSSMYHIYTCSCGFVSENEEHFSYTYSSIRLNGSYHKAYCACGQLIGEEPHRFTTVMGRFICRDCGYERIGSGEIILGKKEDELLQ